MSRDTKWRVQLGTMFHRDTYEPNGNTGLYIRPADGIAAGPRVVFADRADAESFKAAILALIDDARDEGAARSESEDTQPKPTPTQADVDALVKAGTSVIERWDTPNWKDAGPTADRIASLRAALTPFQKG